ncbi:MAG: hypothetical protein ACRDS0_29735 [Pseudonocardiaceae bacterium]
MVKIVTPHARKIESLGLNYRGQVDIPPSGLHENLPSGVPPADNELGWRMSLDKLARLVERDH